jgi:hypothetical protein
MKAPHICSTFVRNYATAMKPLSEKAWWDLSVIADQFDHYMNGYFDIRRRHEPYAESERQKLFVDSYLEYSQ